MFRDRRFECSSATTAPPHPALVVAQNLDCYSRRANPSGAEAVARIIVGPAFI